MEKTRLAALIGAGLAAAVSTAAVADSNGPFKAESSGYNLADASSDMQKNPQAKCGAGHCGTKTDKSSASTEASTGQGDASSGTTDSKGESASGSCGAKHSTDG